MAENKSDDPYNSHESRTEELLFTISHLRPYFPKEFECIKKAKADAKADAEAEAEAKANAKADAKADASSQNNEEFISKLIEYGEQDEQCEDITIMNWLKNKTNPPTLTEKNIRKVVVYAIRFIKLKRKDIFKLCDDILKDKTSSAAAAAGGGPLTLEETNPIITMLNVELDFFLPTGMNQKNGGEKDTGILKCLLQKRS